MTVAFITVILILCAVVAWQRKLSLDETTRFNGLLAHRDAEIERVLADNKDLRDRIFVRNGLPPAGVNMQASYEQRMDPAREPSERKLGTALGPREKAFAAACEAEASRPEQMRRPVSISG